MYIYFSGFRNVSNSLATITLISAVLHTVMLVSFTIFGSKWENCRDLFLPINKRVNLYLQLVVFLVALAYSCITLAANSTGCCTQSQWHFGLLAVSFGWANFICLFSKFPFVGEHAITFAKIIWTFLKLALFALLLILASTIILMTIFFDSKALVRLHDMLLVLYKPVPCIQQSPFFSFQRGFVTVLTMVTGELGYMEAFSLSYDGAMQDTALSGNIAMLYPETANFVWVVFLILVPILLTNMLVSIIANSY